MNKERCLWLHIVTDREGAQGPLKGKGKTITSRSSLILKVRDFTSGYLSKENQNAYWKRCKHPYVHDNIIYNSKIWKQHRYPLIDELMKKYDIYVYTNKIQQ